MDRAYSILNVKSVDEEQRILRGVATTPSVDRVGDVIEPRGVRFKNPAPLLWMHRNDQPVGTVKFDKPTDDGVTFEAHIPQIKEAGTLKDRLDEAWQSVKERLVTAVSIGFRVLDDAVEPIKGGGLRFQKIEVLELSLVAIPANADAKISVIKSIDDEQRAASGPRAAGVVRLIQSPGVSGTKSPAQSGSVKLIPRTYT